MIPEGRAADAEVQLEVDELILDYILHDAIKALLEDAESRTKGQSSAKLNHLSAEAHLALVDCEHTRTPLVEQLLTCPLPHLAYLSLYKSQHPNQRPPAGIRLRLQVLQFAILFLCRWSPQALRFHDVSLDSLRQRNRERVEKFFSRCPESLELEALCDSLDHIVPLPQAVRANNLARTLVALNLPPSMSTLDDQSHCVSLQDSLPSFMYLSAAIAAAEDIYPVDEYWMTLASDYMLQASLEQYQIHGGSGDAIRRPVFAWGYVKYEEGGELITEEEAAVNAMFQWHEDGGYEMWERMRVATMEKVGSHPSLLLLAWQCPLTRGSSFLWRTTHLVLSRSVCNTSLSIIQSTSSKSAS